ncbi:V-type ATPase 116kDa subunit family protein [Estrella lausannensis]|uniref:V-type sodium ATPase subunit I n=1 Tax=Estrella lausannensis TaxID=483423 RepID=A0A0H5DPS3_9BACT|nr:V-type ATPase 116kDa subunit family protein [Estrella lausannensis]CRX38023.1 V-type sodium ATPase subunit I [Estrella lausannensis]
MRIDVKKYLFVGTEESKAPFFTKAQELGIIHFIQEGAKGRELPDGLQKILHAIKILRGLPVVEQLETDRLDEAFLKAEEIIGLKERIEKLLEEDRILKLEIARIEIFGEFSLQDLEYIKARGQRTISFLCAKKGRHHDETLPDHVLFVATDHGMDYFVSIAEKYQPIEGMVEMKIEKTVGELSRRRHQAEVEVRELESKLKSLAKYNTYLHHAFIEHLNGYHLQNAKESTEKAIEGQLFFTTAFVPANKTEELKRLVEEMNVHFEEVAIEETDTIPTYLENKGIARIGEDLVHIYDTPSFTDRDPSLWVFFAFALFFSMIIGDAGYGFILLCVCLWLKFFKFPTAKGTGRRVLNLSVILFSCCVAWGLLTTSVFGLSFPPDSPLRKFSLTTYLAEQKIAYSYRVKDASYDAWIKEFPETASLTDPKEIISKGTTGPAEAKEYVMLDKTSQGLMVEIALMVGVVHIILSLFRYLDRNYTALGWIIFLIGGVLYIPEYLHENVMAHYLFDLSHESLESNGLALMGIGTFMAVAVAIWSSKILGILEVMTVIQIFADILSYLRLYALGLAGGIVSATVNGFAEGVFFAGGVLILIVGHSINIALAIMGGVIHGLRLNFLEWYHYSFQGGGRMFDPLKKIDIE